MRMTSGACCRMRAFAGKIVPETPVDVLKARDMRVKCCGESVSGHA